MPPKSLLAGGGALAIAVYMIGSVEGIRNQTYIDTAGVATICYGHTASVKIGQSLSDAECEKLRANDLATAFAAIDRHVRVPLSDTTRAALASFVFNVGAGAFQKSTMLKLLNAGNTKEACNQMAVWVCERTPPGKGDGDGWCKTKARDKRKSQGLVNRREVEMRVCLYGI